MELFEMIKKIPGNEEYFFKDSFGDICFDNSLIVGAFSGRGFCGSTEKEAVEKCDEYFSDLLGWEDECIVKSFLIEKGYPDIFRFYKNLMTKE